jgi:protein-tyrosine phosphatase
VRSPTPESYWVVEGAVLAGKYPGAKVDADAERKVATLVAAGVTLFVDLTEDGELLPYSHLLPKDVAHHRVAVKDVTSPVFDQLVEVLNLIDEGRRSGVVYVHCRGGCGRTGVVIGAYLVRHGLPPKTALARIHELSRTLWNKPCPETSDQIETVMGWVSGA